MDTTIITKELFLWTIFSSTVMATIIGVLLGWIKEYFQKRIEREQKQFEKLYGPLIYQLLAIRVLNFNRKELLEEINKESIPDNADAILKKYSDINPINSEWRKRIFKLIDLFQENAGYIKKQHINLIENFLDACVKRDITKGGKSVRATKERIEKIFDSIEALQKELL